MILPERVRPGMSSGTSREVPWFQRPDKFVTARGDRACYSEWTRVEFTRAKMERRGLGCVEGKGGVLEDWGRRGV